MNMTSLKEIAINRWKKVSDTCKDAAVFIDDNAAELLHWAGGLEVLEGCVGVYNMYKELNSLAKDFIAAAPYSCVVFVVTSFLGGECSMRINRLLTDLQPLNCNVFTTKSEKLHGDWNPMPGGQDGAYSHFGEFQVLLRKWINRETGVRVSVQHLPLTVAQVCPGVFITPTNSSFFPLLPSALEEINLRVIKEGDVNCSLEHLGQVDFDMLTHSWKLEVKSLAESLNYLLEGMDCREELFSLGFTSRMVASQLAALPQAKARRKTVPQCCSLLLVDRALDLVGPSAHLSETLADRILSMHSNNSQLSSDVCVDMTLVLKNKDIINGSLAQSSDDRAQYLLKTLFINKQKESLMEMSRYLLESLSQEGLSVKLTGKLARPSAAQLTAFLQEFRQQPNACLSQRGILQLACAVVQALEGPQSKWWDKLASLEKVLMLSANDPNSPSILAQLSELTRGQILPGAEPLTLSDLLGIIVTMFSLLGDSCIKKQTELDQLKDDVTELVLHWRDCDTETITLLGIEKNYSRMKTQGEISKVFRILEGIGECRNELKQFRQLSERQGRATYTPLVSQLADAVFNPSHPELSDVDFHSQGSMSNIIKSSFSLFVSSARPHPTHQPIVLIFVVGGVTASEVRSIQESVSAHKSKVKVLVGGTRLVSHSEIIKALFDFRRNSH